MISNKLPLVVLGVACVAAAGTGAYLATRQAASTAEAVVASPPPPRAAEAVQETEAVVGDGGAPKVAPVPVEATRPAPRRPAAARPPAQPAAAPQAAQSNPPPALDRSWPSSTQAQPSPTPLPAQDEPVAPVEMPRPPEPPSRVFEELVVSADSVIGLRLESTISSERARVEDPVEAQIVRDVRADGAVAIPAGARALGSVTFVERGGRFKEQARLGIRFHTLVLADGTRMPINTEAITRSGDAPANGSAAKIGGGAVAGAILGAILGGAKGAAIGATSGAGAGTAVVMTGERSAATFPAGTEVTARILSPVTITVEK